jgi:hypothetical protein
MGGRRRNQHVVLGCQYAQANFQTTRAT